MAAYGEELLQSYVKELKEKVLNRTGFPEDFVSSAIDSRVNEWEVDINEPIGAAINRFIVLLQKEYTVPDKSYKAYVDRVKRLVMALGYTAADFNAFVENHSLHTYSSTTTEANRVASEIDKMNEVTNPPKVQNMGDKGETTRGNDKLIERYTNRVKDLVLERGYSEEAFYEYVAEHPLDVGVPASTSAHRVAHGIAKNIQEEIIATYPLEMDYPEEPEEKTPVEDESEPEPDMVNHPAHYLQGGIETIDLMEYKYGTKAVIVYCVLNVEKYRERAAYKGNRIQDEQKALWYLNKSKELKDKVKNGIGIGGILEGLLS